MDQDALAALHAATLQVKDGEGVLLILQMLDTNCRTLDAEDGINDVTTVGDDVLSCAATRFNTVPVHLETHLVFATCGSGKSGESDGVVHHGVTGIAGESFAEAVLTIVLLSDCKKKLRYRFGQPCQGCR